MSHTIEDSTETFIISLENAVAINTLSLSFRKTLRFPGEIRGPRNSELCKAVLS